MFPSKVDLAGFSRRNVFTSAGLILMLSILVSFWSGISPQLPNPSKSSGLRDDFYAQSCPRAETIINQTLTATLSRNRSLAAGLLRMAFHDCFVQGCDASVLLSSDWNGSLSERDATPNKNSLKGFEVIQDIKTRLERVCPNTVSCADIVVLAARHAVVQTGGPYYNLTKGRRDSRNSSNWTAGNELPNPLMDVSTMINVFQQKGFDEKDLVSLLGSHTIGVANCSTFAPRLTKAFSNAGIPDARLNVSLFFNLTTACRNAADSNSSHISLDPGSTFVFDNSYYKNLVLGRGLLATDQALMDNPITSALVQAYSQNQELFFEDFKNGMIKLSNLAVLSGKQGEIRNNCSAQN